MPRDMHYSDTHLDIPLTQGIVLVRTEQGFATNVPHLVCWHSPDGFNSGYGGSGPADLALNLAEIILRKIGYEGNLSEPLYDGRCCFEAAARMHQDVKWKFIAPALAGSEPGKVVIPFAEVRDYIADRLLDQEIEDRQRRYLDGGEG